MKLEVDSKLIALRSIAREKWCALTYQATIKYYWYASVLVAEYAAHA